MKIEIDAVVAAGREYARINRILNAYRADLDGSREGPLPTLDGIEMVPGLTLMGSLRAAFDRAKRDLLEAAAVLPEV